jgi:siroheme synthase (precorrin-2 oxidase/ferrochelatase)
MSTNLTISPSDHIVLVGTGESAMTALWRLCAAGARIRWYVDSADVSEEAFFAHALGRGRVELSFDDPLTASLDDTTAIVLAGGESRHARLVERARASGVAVQFVGDDGLSGFAFAGPRPVRPRPTAGSA